MLQLLHARGIGGPSGAWTDGTYKAVMMHAGVHDELAVLQWARQLAPAVWPDQLWAPPLCTGWLPKCWSLQCLQWAVSQGCPWGMWTDTICSTASDAKVVSSEAIDKAEREARRAWAHANDCPCSCAR
jgi:hypothetical protein